MPTIYRVNISNCFMWSITSIFKTTSVHYMKQQPSLHNVLTINHNIFMNSHKFSFTVI